MLLEQVKSTSVKAIGYDRDKKDLYVEFIGGNQYVYSAVPEEVYLELIEASSKGNYVSKQIAYKYNFVKIK